MLAQHVWCSPPFNTTLCQRTGPASHFLSLLLCNCPMSDSASTAQDSDHASRAGSPPAASDSPSEAASSDASAPAAHQSPTKAKKKSEMTYNKSDSAVWGLEDFKIIGTFLFANCHHMNLNKQHTQPRRLHDGHRMYMHITQYPSAVRMPQKNCFLCSRVGMTPQLIHLMNAPGVRRPQVQQT